MQSLGMLAVLAIYVGTVAAYNPPGPAQGGCNAAGVSCCYSPTWWQAEIGTPSVTCADGSFTRGTPDAADALNECQGPPVTTCVQNFCNTLLPPTCVWVEESGDHVSSYYANGPGKCENNNWKGQTINVYSKDNFKSANDEIVWGDVTPPGNEPGEGENCNGNIQSSYSITGTYSHTTGWNIGGQFGLKLPSGLLGKVVTSLAPEIKVTGGYTDTTSQGTNAGITVTVPTGQHGTATKGTLIHHSYGHWVINSGTVPGGGKLNGCKKIQINNVGIDMPADPSNPQQPGGWGVESKPCGYPLLNGKVQ